MSNPFERRSFLFGMLGGVTLGGGTGFFSGRVSAPAATASNLAGHSYAQQGEDLVVSQILLEQLRVIKPTYVDIGAHDPIHGSNTYLFYELGFRGLLIEPNPTYAEKLRRVRPGDQVLEAGIGPSVEDVLSDYYVVRGDGQLNTFSKEQADRIVQSHGVIEKITKVKLININKVLAQYFPNAAPDFFSVDTEGLDLDILRSLDFARFRPKVVCAETCKMSGLVDEDIMALMKSRNYTARGGSYVNTVFVDNRIVPGADVEAKVGGDAGRDGG